MDTSKSEKFRGIVIASKSDQKNGKILEIYTVELGRIKAYVRSAYDLRDNVARSSFVFTESEFTLSQYKEIFMVNDSKVLYAPKLLDTDMKKLHDFAFLSELLVTLLNTQEGDDYIYTMILTMLNIMDIYPEKAELIILAFILKLIYILGYFPRIQIKDGLNSYSFNYEDGVIIPRDKAYSNKAISIKDISFMKHLLNSKFTDLIDIDCEEKSIANLKRLFINYILYIFDKDEFKTLKVKYWGGQNVFSRFNDESTKLLEGQRLLSYGALRRWKRRWNYESTYFS